MTAQVRCRVRTSSIVCCVVLTAGSTASGLTQWQGTVTVGARAYGVAADSFFRSEPTFTAELDSRLPLDGLDLALGAWLRVDPLNRRRSRFDLLDLALSVTTGDFDFTVGFRKFSWGVLESAWLVDVVNQVDPHARWPKRQTLSQPTVGGTWFTRLGTLQAYLLPWARPRPFEGRHGRLWSPHRVDGPEHRYTASGSLGRHLALATRWSWSSASWETTVTYFVGTARQPRFLLEEADGEEPRYVPTYDRIRKIGLQAQYAAASWLWKIELASANPDKSRYVALGAGSEYALASYLSTFLEITFDSRGRAATTSLEHDAFLGSRLLLPDGSLTAGAFLDVKSWNVIASLAVSWRLRAGLVLALDARWFNGDESREPPLALREEASVALSLRQYF